MYDRLKELIDYQKLEKKNILLIGVGGVGSSIFEALIRSGIKNITIYDYDTYEVSNINRQIHANLTNINEKKVEVLKKHCKNINPDINIIVKDEYLNEESIIKYKEYDYIIDACDSIPAKINLIKNAYKYNKKIIISCGVGNRVDPTKLEITSLDKINGDPLGKKLKTELLKRNLNTNVLALSSKELPKKSKNIKSYIGVTLYAGVLIADYVIKDLTK